MRSVYRYWLVPAAIAAMGVFAMPAQAQTTVGSPRQSGLLDVRVQDHGSYTTQIQWGQTFRTPNASDISLTSWTTWASNYYAAYYGDPSIAATLPFVLAIYEWGGTAPMGSALFTSAPESPTDNTTTGAPLTFTIGQILDPTKIYLALVTPPSINVPVGPMYVSAVKHSCNADCGNSDPYTDGGLIGIRSYYDNAGNLTYQSIENWEQGYDMAFSATFDAPVSAFNARVTATPEPASMTLIATGMAGLAGYARRRRKAR